MKKKNYRSKNIECLNDENLNFILHDKETNEFISSINKIKKYKTKKKFSKGDLKIINNCIELIMTND